MINARIFGIPLFHNPFTSQFVGIYMNFSQSSKCRNWSHGFHQHAPVFDVAKQGEYNKPQENRNSNSPLLLCVCIYVCIFCIPCWGGPYIYIYTHTYLEYPNKLPPDHSSKQHPTRSRWWGPCQTSAFRTWLWWRMPMCPGRMGLALARRKTHEMSRQHTKRCGKAMGEPYLHFELYIDGGFSTCFCLFTGS